MISTTFLRSWSGTATFAAGVASSLLAAALLAAPLPAQGSQVELDVKDSQGQAVADVTVMVEQKEGGFATELVSNKKGRIKTSIDGPPGTYVFRLEKSGYAPTERELELQQGMVTSATLVILTAPERAIVVYNEGAQALQSGGPTAALAKFEEALQFDPDLAPAYLGIAVIHHNRKAYDKAAEALAGLEQLGHPEIQAPAIVAYETYLHTGDQTKRQAAKQRLAGADAKDGAVVAYNEAVRLYRAKEASAALELLAEARELDPQRSEIFQTTAAIHFNEGEFAQALPYLEQALELDPDNTSALRMMVFSAFETGDRAKAEAALRSWSSQGDAAAKEVIEQAETRFTQDQNDAARALAEIVLAVEPDHARAHYLLGRLLVASGEFARGKQELSRFLELAPGDPEAADAKAMLADL